MGTQRLYRPRRQATVVGLEEAMAKRHCLQCGCVYTEGTNTSHACAYHPGEPERRDPRRSDAAPNGEVRRVGPSSGPTSRL
jgi:hypothetical protein